MVDIESQVFDKIAKVVREEYPGIHITGEYVAEPPKFPHVTIIEDDNYVDRLTLDNSDSEAFAVLNYTVEVFTNDAVGKKSKAKAILKTIDDLMYSMNFTRTVRTPVPNMNNDTIYRIVARYDAESDGKEIFRR